MQHILYPTRYIVEYFLTKYYRSSCDLSEIIKTLGCVKEKHDLPNKYGTLSVRDPNTGIDIPILILDLHSTKGTIAIVAQDPYRSKSDPMLTGFSFSSPIVGTPFAYHYKEENYPKTKVYRNVINKLLWEGYGVYVTDVHKFYPNKPKKIVKSPEIDCLKEELEKIEPQLVVTFGTDAKEYVDKVAGEIRDICDLLNTTYDKFIRTTDDYHEKVVQKILKKKENLEN